MAEGFRYLSNLERKLTTSLPRFPVTVWSQLTTGPMLDLVAPEDKVSSMNMESENMPQSKMCDLRLALWTVMNAQYLLTPQFNR